MNPIEIDPKTVAPYVALTIIVDMIIGLEESEKAYENNFLHLTSGCDIQSSITLFPTDSIQHVLHQRMVAGYVLITIIVHISNRSGCIMKGHIVARLSALNKVPYRALIFNHLSS
jgi:hypothetical protein